HAIYHKSLLPVVDHRINSGNLSLQSLLEDIPCHIVSPADILKVCPSLGCLSSANTPEKLARLEKFARTNPQSCHESLPNRKE
ncbi:MAG: hypothetical protein KAU41_01785, partial [Deltaproteobacteria bacterium]|nr:hypothetical protein [Deltaproteobacteria bacterium]